MSATGVVNLCFKTLSGRSVESSGWEVGGEGAATLAGCSRAWGGGGCPLPPNLPTLALEQQAKVTSEEGGTWLGVHSQATFRNSGLLCFMVPFCSGWYPDSKRWFMTSFLQPLSYLVMPWGPENCQLLSEQAVFLFCFCWCSNSSKFVTNNSNKTIMSFKWPTKFTPAQIKPQSFKLRQSSFYPGWMFSCLRACFGARLLLQSY